MKAITLFLLILPYVLPGAAKRVVFFPFFQTSHVTSFIRMAQALSDLHHETWVCVPHFTYNKDIFKADKVNLLPYGHDLGDLDEDFFLKTGLLSHFWYGTPSFFQLFAGINGYMHNLSYNIFTNPSLLSALEDIRPDYFVLDSMPLLPNALALPYKFQVPFSFLGVAYDAIGARVTFSPAAVPSMIFQESFTSETTFIQRLKKTFGYFLILIGDPVWNPSIIETLIPEKPPPSSSRFLIPKADLHLVENDVVLGYAYPKLENTVMIGGTSGLPAKKLPEEFESLIKTSKNGIVLISFGSSIANFPPEISAKMFTALQQLPYHTIWRVNLTSPYKQKITTATWIPQNDLLGHNNGSTIYVFISHCGAWGQYEALYHGVPILCLPIFADQLFNSHRIQDKGFGTFADIRTISADELASLIREVASNNTYRRNIITASALYKELYKSPTKTGAYWLDHVMRHGSRHLRSVGQDMPVYQLLLVDVLAFVALSLLLLVFLVFSCVRYCCSNCCRKSSDLKKEKIH